ncbi:MAG: PspC domain-containing protein [Candidatus Gracilibacteria bacterium]|jgi:phage shock protein C
MKKVINITIGGMVWSVEEDAYEQLFDYLNSIKNYFSKDKDGDEIVEDLEASIAEKFLKRKVKTAPIMEKDVADIMKEIGTLKDFKKMSEEEEDLDENEEVKSSGEKKLYRDPDDSTIAGVCSGLAAYFGIETVLMRLIFVVTIFFGGFGILIYLVLWAVMPVAESTAQKMEMRGERLTLHEIEKSVKREVEMLKKKDLSGVKKAGSELKVFLEQVFGGSGKFLQSFGAFLQRLIGLLFILIGVAGVCSLSFGLTWQLSGGMIPQTGLTVHDFLAVEGVLYWIFLAATYVVTLVPMLFFFLGGLSLVRNKNLISMNLFIFLLLLFFVASGISGSVITQNYPLIQQRVQELEARY